MSDQFVYVSTFLSIVVALALTHLLAGIGGLLRSRVSRISWRHALWLGIYMFACVDYWFSIWGLRGETVWTLGFVLYLLALATLLYVGAHLVVPRLHESDDIDLSTFEEGNRRKYLAPFFVYVAIAILGNLIVGGFADAIWINIVVLVLVATASQSQQPLVHTVVTLTVVGLLVIYAFKYIPAL